VSAQAHTDTDTDTDTDTGTDTDTDTDTGIGTETQTPRDRQSRSWLITCMARSITVPAARGAAILIIAMTFLASLDVAPPVESIRDAARSTSSLAWSINNLSRWHDTVSAH